jgi:SAM-dependent methyltransferase
MPIDEAKLEQAFGAVVTDMAGAMTARMVRLGDRLGLYRALAGAGPTTPGALAARSGCDERYLQEWMSQQFAAGYLDYDPAQGAFTLPDEYAAILADEEAPVFVAGMAQILGSTYLDEDRLETAFRSGAGVGWHEHHHDLFEGTRRLFRPGYQANLVSSWIPALDGAEARLRAGAAVADVGCGLGASTIVLAQAFPASTFVGWDYHAESVEHARKAAADAGVADRVRFEVGSAKDVTGGPYDLVALFDCLHDMGDPVGALRHLRKLLADDGSVLVVEPFAGERLEDNVGPVAKIFYTASTLVCTPASKSQEVGLALGAQASEQQLREVALQAGFGGLVRATETPVNRVLQLTP